VLAWERSLGEKTWMDSFTPLLETWSGGPRVQYCE
jgi:hypothetical protein